MNVYYDRDCDIALIKSKKVTIVGYGSQGHAHACNLKDSGIDVTVALREGSTSAIKAKNAGLKLKLIVDLMYEGGIANMTSNAEYGEYETGPKVINDQSRAAMKECLNNIQSGEYTKRFILEGMSNYPEMTARRRINAAHPIEQTGEKLRSMMPWIQKIVDKTKN